MTDHKERGCLFPFQIIEKALNLLLGKTFSKNDHDNSDRPNKPKPKPPVPINNEITRPLLIARFDNIKYELCGKKIVLDSITLIGCHTKPSNAYNEMMKLIEKVYSSVLKEFIENLVIILDDLNANFTRKLTSEFNEGLIRKGLVYSI
ncbi:4159_t:CDS:2, partial [Dentiscutata heterogama]